MILWDVEIGGICYPGEWNELIDFVQSTIGMERFGTSPGWDAQYEGKLIYVNDLPAIRVGASGAWLTLFHFRYDSPIEVTVHDNATERSSNSSSYVKVKEIVLTEAIIGDINLYFQLKSGASLTTAYGRIYYNGAPIGTEQSTTNLTYVPESENFVSVTWAVGDTLELWVKNSIGGGANTAIVNNFQIRGTRYVIE